MEIGAVQLVASGSEFRARARDHAPRPILGGLLDILIEQSLWRRGA